MKYAYCDCFSGVSGDMFLGALVDAGVPVETLRENIGLLSLPEPVRFAWKKRIRARCAPVPWMSWLAKATITAILRILPR